MARRCWRSSRPSTPATTAPVDVPCQRRPRRVAPRVETLVIPAAPSWPMAAVRQYLARPVDVVIHVSRAGKDRPPRRRDRRGRPRRRRAGGAAAGAVSAGTIGAFSLGPLHHRDRDGGNRRRGARSGRPAPVAVGGARGELDHSRAAPSPLGYISVSLTDRGIPAAGQGGQRRLAPRSRNSAAAIACIEPPPVRLPSVFGTTTRGGGPCTHERLRARAGFHEHHGRLITTGTLA